MQRLKGSAIRCCIVVALMLALVAPCFAAVQLTANARHTSIMHPGGSFNLTGYLYYSDNTATSITCNKLGFSVKNTSTGDTDITAAVFNAYNGNGVGNNNEMTGDYYLNLYFPRVAPGELIAYTTPAWGGVTNLSPVYNKYGAAAIFEMGAGFSEYDCASHQIWSYADLRFSDTTGRQSSLSDVQSTITFTDFHNGLERNSQVTNTYNLSNIRSIDEPFFLETKSAELICTLDGSSYGLASSSVSSDAVTYTFESTENINDYSNIQVVPPVVYMEERTEESFAIPICDSSDLINVEISSSKEKYPDEEEGVLIEFTSLDVEHIPYNMILLSDGQVYDNCSVSYFFDFETGDFIRAELVFVDLTLEQLATNASIEVCSLLNRYVPTNYRFDQ